MSTNELAVQAKNDPAMMLELWRAVERLIAWHSSRYAALGSEQGGRLYDFDDLTQAGYLALVDAVRSFAPEAGMVFTAYLGYHIRRHFAEVAGRRGTKRRPEVYADSLDAPISAEGDTRRVDVLADPAAHLVYDNVVEQVSDRQDYAVVLAEMEKLPEQQRQAITMHICEGQTLKDIAAALGCSLERARQHEASGLRKLRNSKAVRTIGTYRHVTLSRFKQTHTSSVEAAILWLEEQGYYELVQK